MYKELEIEIEIEIDIWRNIHVFQRGKNNSQSFCTFANCERESI